jgi:hypothetical protein
MHATDTGPVRVCLARYEYADDVLEAWGTLRSAAGAPPEPELPWQPRPGGVTAIAPAPVVCPLVQVPNLSEFAEGITGTAAVVRPYCRRDARVCATTYGLGPAATGVKHKNGTTFFLYIK